MEQPGTQDRSCCAAAVSCGAAAVIMWLGFSQPLSAQPASASAVKAAFVLSFLKFVEWPGGVFASAQSPLVLCVAGAPADLSEALSSLDGRPIQGRSLSVRHLADPRPEQGCNVAFWGGNASQPLTAADATPMLTIGDSPGFAARGGMIGLYSDDGKIRFEINPDSVARSSLRVSSQLMKLARITGTNRQGEAR